MLPRLFLFAFVISSAVAAQAQSPDPKLVADAKAALDQATKYYREKVATHGGYVYHYSPDLSVRWGEGLATKDQIWVQPPGTPVVGMAFASAYQATGDQVHLDAARAAARALMHGQLKSGGWTNFVDFDPASKRVGNYLRGGGHKKGNNFSTLDDGITPAALRFLMFLDYVQEFKDAELHEAVTTGLDALLAAQFSCGAFPQGWVEPVLSTTSAERASFPKYDWRTEGRVKNYWDMYNLNDGIAGQVCETLTVAYGLYRDEKYKQAAAGLGDFLIAAQMPEPQPAWCQQYNYDLVPIWARKFEPPAVSGWESQDVLETLMDVYSLTLDEKYLTPIPAALAYLKKSQLADGRMARYYELETNKPLYMNRNGEQYFLTYDDTNLPDHYGWKQESRLQDIERRFGSIKSPPQISVAVSAPKDAGEPWADVRAAIQSLDAEGRWLTTYNGERLVGQPKFKPGDQYLSSELFARNVMILSQFLAAAKPARDSK
jgi:PelA/Pel-15E family pectate lyase